MTGEITEKLYSLDYRSDTGHFHFLPRTIRSYMRAKRMENEMVGTNRIVGEQ